MGGGAEGEGEGRGGEGDCLHTPPSQHLPELHRPIVRACEGVKSEE